MLRSCGSESMTRRMRRLTGQLSVTVLLVAGPAVIWLLWAETDEEQR